LSPFPILAVSLQSVTFFSSSWSVHLAQTSLLPLSEMTRHSDPDVGVFIPLDTILPPCVVEIPGGSFLPIPCKSPTFVELPDDLPIRALRSRSTASTQSASIYRGSSVYPPVSSTFPPPSVRRATFLLQRLHVLPLCGSCFSDAALHCIAARATRFTPFLDPTKLTFPRSEWIFFDLPPRGWFFELV